MAVFFAINLKVDYSNPMHFHIITLFPESFDSYLKESILGRAVENKKIKVSFYNPLKFCPPKVRADDRPYGGGPGMVLRPEFFIKAIDKAISDIERFSRSSGRKAQPDTQKSFNIRKIKIIHFSPSGKKFTTDYAKKTSKKYSDIILICGRYEGIDYRINKIFKGDNISIGDYVLTGGELPAMVLIDSISRQVKGVLGKYESLEEERISSSEVYTRPEVLKYKNTNYRVPKVLLSGNHKKIEEWKNKKR